MLQQRQPTWNGKTCRLASVCPVGSQNNNLKKKTTNSLKKEMIFRSIIKLAKIKRRKVYVGLRGLEPRVRPKLEASSA